jgi:Zn finger protein HypA/HybF involved in hydrogenase expression
MGADREISEDVHVLACAECPRVSSLTARGWKAYRVEAPERDEPPQLAFYCPECAAKESDSR